jgi:hypothetical protein
LIAGQTAQIATLAAGLEYLETRTPEGLTGPSGVLAGQAAMIRAFHDFQNRQRAFLEIHGLVTPSPDPGRRGLGESSRIEAANPPL